MSATFAVGDRVRYKPGFGTYGYEDLLEADGRIPATIRGFKPPRKDTGTGRVSIEFFRGRTPIRRAVDAGNLQLEKNMPATAES